MSVDRLRNVKIGLLYFMLMQVSDIEAIGEQSWECFQGKSVIHWLVSFPCLFCNRGGE